MSQFKCKVCGHGDYELFRTDDDGKILLARCKACHTSMLVKMISGRVCTGKTYKVPKNWANLIEQFFGGTP